MRLAVSNPSFVPHPRRSSRGSRSQAPCSLLAAPPQREDPVPRADVEHALAAKIGRQLEWSHAIRRVVDARRHDPVSQIDLVIPVDPGDLLPDELGVLEVAASRHLRPLSSRRRPL